MQCVIMLRMLAVEEKMEKGLFRKDKANTDFSLDSYMHLVCTLSKMTPPRKSVKSPCFPNDGCFRRLEKKGKELYCRFFHSLWLRENCSREKMMRKKDQ